MVSETNDADNWLYSRLTSPPCVGRNKSMYTHCYKQALLKILQWIVSMNFIYTVQSDLCTTSPLVVLPYTSIQSDLFTTTSLVLHFPTITTGLLLQPTHITTHVNISVPQHTLLQIALEDCCCQEVCIVKKTNTFDTFSVY